MQSNPVFPIKYIRSLDYLDGTLESSQEHCHMKRSTLISTQEGKTAQCTPNQFEMKPISPSLAPWRSRVPQHTVQAAWLPLGNYRDSLRHQSQGYMNINFSTVTRGKLHAPHKVSRWELIICLWCRGKPTFHKHLKWSFPSAIAMWEGPWVFCLKWNGLRGALTQKKARFPWSG